MEDVHDWLLAGDPAIRWQVLRDLTDAPASRVAKERGRVAREGWGARLLDARDPEGTWAGGLYGPKWISTTYTLMLLYRYGIDPTVPEVVDSVELLLERGVTPGGGVTYFQVRPEGETCVTGMLLALAAYVGRCDNRTDRMIEWLLAEQLDDGGWNCRRIFDETHGSFHTTIAVLEGIAELEAAAPGPLLAAAGRAREFFLRHHLFRSERTGEPARPEFTRFSFPPRWHYDVLRGLEHFRRAHHVDPRLEPALELVRSRRRRDGRWPLQNVHRGRVWFEMERGREPSRWNTLRALRVLRWSDG